MQKRHTEPDLLWETPRALKRPGRARTVGIERGLSVRATRTYCPPLPDAAGVGGGTGALPAPAWHLGPKLEREKY